MHKNIPVFYYALFATAACLIYAEAAQATPSTQIWIPSPDIQKFATVHLNDDAYARPGKPTFLVLGPTAGLLPWKAFQAEAGFDLFFQGNKELDKRPLYLNGKLGFPEDGVFKWSPALVGGIYNVGFKHNLTDQDVGYLLLGRTLPIVGRLSAGYYLGNGRVLVDEDGDPSNHGLLLSWDRTLSELTDKLWLAVDFQQGRSFLGAVNFAFAWAFAPNVSVILGYDHYLNQKVAGKDTLTVQVDINVEFISGTRSGT